MFITLSRRNWSKESIKGEVAMITTVTSQAAGAVGTPKVILFGPSIGTKQVTYFDKNNNEIETHNYKADGNLANKIVNTYDDKDRFVNGTNYTPNGTLSNSWSIQYDNKGNKIEERSNFYDLGHTMTDVFIYDRKGNLLKKNSSMKFYSTSNTSTINTVYKYNDVGREFEQIETKYEKPHGRGVMKFNDKYYLIEEVHYSEKCYGCGELDSIPRWKRTFNYDDNGAIIEIEDKKYHRYPKAGEELLRAKYDYVYDKFGNWTKKTVFENDNAVAVIERTIQYR